MIVGEAPWTDELAIEQPFVGDAGRTLDDWLSVHEVTRTGLYVTNANGDVGPELRKRLIVDELSRAQARSLFTLRSSIHWRRPRSAR